MNTPAPASIPRRLAERVLDWSDERDSGHRIIVTTARGWRFRAPDGHVLGADNVKAAIAELRTAEPCECARCRADER